MMLLVRVVLAIVLFAGVAHAQAPGKANGLLTPWVGYDVSHQLTLPVVNGVVATTDSTQTLSNKTLASPTFTGSYTLGGTPTFPAVGPGANTYGGGANYVNSLTLDNAGRVASLTLGTPGGSSLYSAAPISGVGTIGDPFTIAPQLAHCVLAGPTSGTATPTCRALVAADIPSLAYDASGAAAAAAAASLSLHGTADVAASLNFTLTIGGGGTGATTASAARTNLGLAIGTNVEAQSAQLDALASLSTNGILARTAANTFALRTITPSTGIGVSNGDGIAGNPTISNTGVTSLTGGGGITVSASTGGITLGASGIAESSITSLVSDLAGKDAAGAAAAAQAASLQISNNLSDLNSASAARGNLGLGSSATHPTTDYDAAGAAAAAQAAAIAASLQRASNLSDLASASAARGNLGLGSSATHPTTDYDASGAAAAAQAASLPLHSKADTAGNADTATNGVVTTGSYSLPPWIASLSGGVLSAGSVPNSALTNSSITVGSTSPLTGGGAASLGGSVTLACSACVTTNSSPSFGIVTASTSVLTPLLDTASAIALAIGTTNATSIALKQNTTLPTGKTLTVGANVLITSDKLVSAQLDSSSETISTTSPLGGGGSISIGGSLMLTCSTCVTTDGSYADPAWITSLSGSKLVAGSIANAALANSTVNFPVGNGLQGGGSDALGSTATTIDLRLNASGGLTKTLGAGSNEAGIVAGGVTNAMLANSSATLNTTSPVGGGGTLTLGSSLTLTCTTCVVTSDTRLNPTPSVAGRFPVDTGSVYSFTPTPTAVGQVLQWNGSTWAPVSLLGGNYGDGSDGAVTLGHATTTVSGASTVGGSAATPFTATNMQVGTHLYAFDGLSTSIQATTFTCAATTTTGDVTQPAVNSTVTFPVVDTSWMVAGNHAVWVTAGPTGVAGGLYLVSSVTDSTHVVLTNTGKTVSVSAQSNAAAAATIKSGAYVGLAFIKNGYPIMAQSTITIPAGCAVLRDGNDGNGQTAGGAITATGVYGAGSAGGTGGAVNTIGGTAGSSTHGLGGAGGTGGAAHTGGASGPAGTQSMAKTDGPYRGIESATTGFAVSSTTKLNGGGGGGGGGGDTSSGTGAGGGSGGGVDAFFAGVSMTVNGIVRAAGGNGGAATTNNAAGGGPGGGGWLYIVTPTGGYTVGSSTIPGTGYVGCPVGVVGAGHGSGDSGAGGAAGTVFQVSM